VDLAGVEHYDVPGADGVFTSQKPRRPNATFGHRYHELIVAMGRETELNIASPKQLQAAQRVASPKMGFVLLPIEVLSIHSTHGCCLALQRKNIQDNPRSTA
jgi:hypothetical protein